MAATGILIDDNPFTRRLLCAVLERENLRIVEHDPSHSALPEAVARAASLFLVDVVMPERDGLEIIREIRKRGWTAPILAYSQAERRYLDWASKLGADAVIGIGEPEGMRRLVETARSYAARAG